MYRSGTPALNWVPVLRAVRKGRNGRVRQLPFKKLAGFDQRMMLVNRLIKVVELLFK